VEFGVLMHVEMSIAIAKMESPGCKYLDTWVQTILGLCEHCIHNGISRPFSPALDCPRNRILRHPKY